MRDTLSRWYALNSSSMCPICLFSFVAAATASTVGLGPACASSAATALEKAKEYAVAASAKGLTTVHADALEAFCTQAGVELIPVAAVVAGQLGQEVVKLLSGKDEPLQNVFLFDAMGGGGGSVFRIDN